VSKSILIAGIGNIFHGDDAFGVAVAQKLAAEDWPQRVHVVDFGIRAIDLAFALLDGHDLTILVDATARGSEPGTLYVIEPDIDYVAENTGEDCVNSHALDPAKVLLLAKNLGAQFKRILVVGCEPLTLGEEEEGRMGLSAIVEAAIDPAIETIRRLVSEFENQQEIAEYAEAVEGY